MATIMVRQQILEVEIFGEESDGVQLQRRLPGVCAEVVSPALEASLARIDRAGERVRIDRVEVDLHDVDLERLEIALADAVERGIGDYLRDHPTRSPTSGSGAELDDGADAEAAGASDGGTDAPTVEGRATERESLEDALIHFLRTGRLPWSMRLAPSESFEHIVLRAWSSGDGPEALSPALRRRLGETLREPAARSRVALQFTPRFAVALLRGLSPHVAAVAGEVLSALADDSVPPSARRSLALRVWDVALLAAAHDERLTAARLVRRAARSATLAGADERTVADALDERWPGSASELGRERTEPTMPRPKRDAPEQGRSADEAAGILVEEAGLILLHPYLERLFTGVGIVVDGELVDPGRAVCLLHHLATGEVTAPEHRITLAKALCGIPLEEPVAADAELTEADVAEATALLEAVIRHWGALGNATPDGLREGFLRRDGVLSVDAWGDWLLRIEVDARDILLEDLPWGVSIIHLPWMPHRLLVERG